MLRRKPQGSTVASFGGLGDFGLRAFLSVATCRQTERPGRHQVANQVSNCIFRQSIPAWVQTNAAGVPWPRLVSWRFRIARLARVADSLSQSGRVGISAASPTFSCRLKIRRIPACVWRRYRGRYRRLVRGQWQFPDRFLQRHLRRPRRPICCHRERPGRHRDTFWRSIVPAAGSRSIQCRLSC